MFPLIKGYFDCFTLNDFCIEFPPNFNPEFVRNMECLITNKEHKIICPRSSLSTFFKIQFRDNISVSIIENQYDY